MSSVHNHRRTPSSHSTIVASAIVPKGVVQQRLTDVEATPSKPPDALTELQSPIVAACEPPVLEVVPPRPEPVSSVAISAKPEPVLADFSGVVSPVPGPVLPVVVSLGLDVVPLMEDVDGLESPVAVPPGCWHCHDGSGAQDPSTCSRHCAYAAHTISRYFAGRSQRIVQEPRSWCCTYCHLCKCIHFLWRMVAVR